MIIASYLVAGTVICLVWSVVLYACFGPDGPQDWKRRK